MEDIITMPDKSIVYLCLTHAPISQKVKRIIKLGLYLFIEENTIKNHFCVKNG